VLVSGTSPALTTMAATGDKGASAWGNGLQVLHRLLAKVLSSLVVARLPGGGEGISG
jgi:hypothetical protein